MDAAQEENRQNVLALAHTYPLRIAFIGKARAVKTASSRYLHKNYKFKEMKMADGVVAILRKFYTYEDFPRVKWEAKVRYYDAIYRVDPTVWIRHLERRLSFRPPNSWLVMADVRYRNEVDRLRELGFIIVRINLEEYNVKHLTQQYLDAAPGNMVTGEWYGEKYKADYTLMVKGKLVRDIRPALDSLIKNLTTKIDS